MIDIVKQEASWDRKYADFLSSVPQSLYYYSTPYRELIAELLGCDSEGWIAVDRGRIAGILPMMFSKPGRYGQIANSLPFYGSNGGILLRENLDPGEKLELSQLLLNQALAEVEDRGCGAYTIISNPFDQASGPVLESLLGFPHSDHRIGQITRLPSVAGGAVESRLLSSFDAPRPRNIRRARKEKVDWYSSNEKCEIEFLYAMHRESILAIGGRAKPWEFFESIVRRLDHGDWKIYTAILEGERIAALLLFYFNETVEYITPVTHKDHRSKQPSSLLIFEAMKDAISAGFVWWNWGGTWKTQAGVYDFKRKWGAEDSEYYYFTGVRDRRILEADKQELLGEYPGFFVVPFDRLVTHEEE